MRNRSEWMEWIEHWVHQQGAAPALAQAAAQLIVVGLVLVACVAVNYLARRFILAWVGAVARRTENDWDDILVQRGVFDRLSHLAPALIIFVFLPLAFEDSESIQSAVRRLAMAYMILAGTLAIDALLSAIVDVYEKFPLSRARPIKTYVQVIKILLYLVAAIVVLANLLDRSPWGLLTGLGAMTAVLMLVFKDTILGFVASVQLISHDMVRVGDWIEVPKFGADGDVIDISVTTVKIQNWDKTISMVPTYTLISESFKNWRGMSESGGRRIKRALYLDMNTVEFCSPSMLDGLERIALLRAFVQAQRSEVDAYNRATGADTSERVNGRRMTNLGVFRAYVVAYLRNHPKIHQNLTFLVRQLAPGPHGMPLEIYVFSNDQVWAHYEAIQSDIFDHLLAVIPRFGLRVFQSPSGEDIRQALHAGPQNAASGSAFDAARTPRALPTAPK